MKTKPWKHQAREFEEHRDDPNRALLWHMRTGKTKIVVDLSWHLKRRSRIKGCLIFAPNGVHANWVRRELPAHSWEDGYRAHYWTSALSETPEHAEGLERVCDPGYRGMRYLAVNSEALILPRVQSTIKRFLRSCGGEVLGAFDECHDFRRPGSRRTWLARGLAKKMTHKRILSGTSVLNSPLHAFSQFELVEKGALGFETYRPFKERYAEFRQDQRRNGRRYQRLDHYKNMDELRERMAEWSSVVLREDCDDMPRLLEVTRTIAMSDAQVAAYRRMVQEHLVEIGDGLISAEEGGARVLKLQQILGGFLINEDKEVVSIDDEPPILDALEREVVGTLPGKFVVWCRFREDVRRVVRRLENSGITCVKLIGGMSPTARISAEDRLRDDPMIDGLVGQPKAGGVGRDLSTADAIIWYSSTPDAIDTQQANERATKIGGKAVSLVTFETPGTVHDDIVLSNAGKAALADQVSGRGLRDLLLRQRV